MNLKNFEKTVEPQIVNRGFHYFENEAIAEIEQVEKGEFCATVIGSEDYAVFVKIDDNLTIKSHSCDCPYDWGTVCKHEVAVFYFIKKNKLYQQPLEESAFFKIKEDLAKLDKAALLELMLDLSKKSKLVREYIKWELGHEG